MTYEKETPTVTRHENNSLKETEENHPAYAQIIANRVSSSPPGIDMYGSDLMHRNFISITISTSKKYRNLNSDWYFNDKELIEVTLSEAQWATFVSAMGVGSGVPCTMTRLQGKMIPGIERIDETVETFASEMGQKFAELKADLKEFIGNIDEMKVNNARKAEIRGMLEKVYREVVANTPFVEKQFSEHMEGVVEAAKAEVHGYVTSHVQRAGLAALQDPDPQQVIEYQPKASNQ